MEKLAILKLMIILTFIVPLSGCGKKTAGDQVMPAVEVGVVTIRPERLVLTRELPGRTAAFRLADITPQVNGLILKRAFEEGARVMAGDLLYEIDPAPYQAAFDQARAAVAVAEANLPAVKAQEERFRELVATSAVGKQEYDNALAALRQAEAQLEASKASLAMSRINLSYTPIKAPITGRIGRSSVTEGAMVIAYQPVPLATIQQIDPIYIDVPQSTADLLKLQSRMKDGRLASDNDGKNKVTIIREDGSKYPLEGVLEFRDITVNPATGSVILRVTVPNPDNLLLPGMFVRALINEGVVENAILVPQSGVSRDLRGDPFSWVADKDGNAQVKILTLDRAIGDKWLIASGLSSGDRVIVKGVQRLRPGVAVTVSEITAP